MKKLIGPTAAVLALASMVPTSSADDDDGEARALLAKASNTEIAPGFKIPHEFDWSTIKGERSRRDWAVMCAEMPKVLKSTVTYKFKYEHKVVPYLVSALKRSVDRVRCVADQSKSGPDNIRFSLRWACPASVDT